MDPDRVEHTMDQERDFLGAMLAAPSDAELRRRYADWLDQHGDRDRAAYLRTDPALGRLSYVEWLERDGHLDFFLERFPDVKREADERKATQAAREHRRALAATLDPAWVAFIDAMGTPFEPFYFFNNHGSPRECTAEELPFKEPIGTRGRVVTFASDFREGAAWDPGLMADLRFLTGLPPGNCAYGAATCPLHPFVCQLSTDHRPLRATDVIAALRPRAFRSKYIQTLDATHVPFPGYQPGSGRGVENDEIHNDFGEQHLFENKDAETGEPIDETAGTHGALLREVAGGQLWYVLLHMTPAFNDPYWFSRYVVLFAVGRSPRGDRLIGVISHQVCHNLCD